MLADIWLKWWANESITAPNDNLGKWLGGYVGLGVGSTIAILLATWYDALDGMTNDQLQTNLPQAVIHRHNQPLRSIFPRRHAPHNIKVSPLPSPKTPSNEARAPMSFHNTVDSGTTLNRFSQDLQLIDMELPGTALGVAVGTFSLPPPSATRLTPPRHILWRRRIRHDIRIIEIYGRCPPLPLPRLLPHPAPLPPNIPPNAPPRHRAQGAAVFATHRHAGRPGNHPCLPVAGRPREEDHRQAGRVPAP